MSPCNFYQTVKPTMGIQEKKRRIKDNFVGNDAFLFFFLVFRLGLLSDTFVQGHGTAIDTLVPYLAKEFSYKQNERDLVILNHDIHAQFPGGINVSVLLEDICFYKENDDILISK